MSTQNNQSSKQNNTAPFAPRELHHPDVLRNEDSQALQQTADIAEYAVKYGWSFKLAHEMHGYIGYASMLADLNH